MSNKVRVIECGHCGNTSQMNIVAQYRHEESVGTPPYTDEFYKEWELLLCPACKEPILYEVTWDTFDVDMETGPNYDKKMLYPSFLSSTEGLPKKVKDSYEAALKVRNVEPNAFAVLIGRTLEFVCKDKEAQGRDLYQKLDDLSKKEEIPGRLSAMAQKLRSLRNIGAHADEIELSKKDVPLLIEFTDTILDYIYRAPAKLDIIKNKLEQID